MNDPITAKYYRDLHVLERIGDINLATAIVIGVDPTTYINLNVRNYLKLVFQSVLPRLNPIEIIEILNNCIDDLKVETYQGHSKKAGALKKAIDSKITITNLANKFGLKLVKNRCACIFHKGENKTSLSFDNKTNTFYCFSCGVKGDVIEFYRKMSEVKNG